MSALELEIKESRANMRASAMLYRAHIHPDKYTGCPILDFAHNTSIAVGGLETAITYREISLSRISRLKESQ